MAQVETQVAALELEKVLPKVRQLFERDDKFYATIQKRNVEKISHRQMRVPLELRPGGSFQYFDPDGGDLGRGGGPTYDKAVLNCVFVSENMEYTKLSQWATDDQRKAVQNSVRRLTATALDELRRQLDAQLMQPGNGVVGTISAVSTSGGVDTYTLGSDGFGARLVRFGQEVQVFDATLATNRGSGTITEWDVENKSIKVTPSITGAVATDKLVVKGITAPTSLPGLYGVPYHHSNASTGTWLGFSRVTTPEIRANRVNGGNAALDLPLPRLAVNKIGNRVGIEKNMKMRAWLHPCQQQAYEEIGQLISLIQKGAKEEGLNMYFSGNNMQLAGVPVEPSYNWDKTRIDFIVDDVWGRAEILPIGFYTVDGRNIFELRGASGGVAAAEIFYMVVGMQVFVSNPAACSYIDLLAVPTGY
jgi:hypothetical protein